MSQTVVTLPRLGELWTPVTIWQKIIAIRKGRGEGGKGRRVFPDSGEQSADTELLNQIKFIKSNQIYNK